MLLSLNKDHSLSRSVFKFVSVGNGGYIAGAGPGGNGGYIAGAGDGGYITGTGSGGNGGKTKHTTLKSLTLYTKLHAFWVEHTP